MVERYTCTLHTQGPLFFGSCSLKLDLDETKFVQFWTFRRMFLYFQLLPLKKAVVDELPNLRMELNELEYRRLLRIIRALTYTRIRKTKLKIIRLQLLAAYKILEPLLE